MPHTDLGAIVLTGGTGARLGGVDKAGLVLGGLSLLARALAAVDAAGQVVVVGERTETARTVTWAREQPAGGGPAAGVLAGLDALAPLPLWVCVLAVDMPWVTAATVGRLLDAVSRRVTDPPDGAVLLDDGGTPQTLAAVYRSAALQAARPAAGAHNLSLRSLVGGLGLVEVPAVGNEARDVDTPADLEAMHVLHEADQ